MLIKNQKYVLHSLYVIYFMSLKLIKNHPKILVILQFIRCSYNKSAYKNSKFILHSVYFLEIFQKHPKLFAIFEFVR